MKLTPDDRRKLANLCSSARRAGVALSGCVVEAAANALISTIEREGSVTAEQVDLVVPRTTADEMCKLSHGVTVVYTRRDGLDILSASRLGGRLSEAYFRAICNAAFLGGTVERNPASGVWYCFAEQPLDS